MLLAQNKNLIEIVTPELLYKKVNGISAFFNLASFPKGQEYLLYLFSEKPSLIASLSEEDLYQAPSELEDDYTNSSPFFWCCSSGSEKGPDLLDLIYKTKPILLDALKSSMLAKEYKGNVPCLLSMTPISVLIAIKKYDFLKMLVHRKPVLFSELSLDWIVDRRNDVRPEYRESILALCFIDIEYSFEFLEYFIRYNRKFLEKITLEFLLERRMGTDTEFNLLYHCSWSANGVDLLTLIIGYNPLLGSAISSEHLNTVFLNQSILFILTTQYKGIKLLQRLSHLNQNLSVNLLVTQLDQQTFQDTPLVNLLLSKAGVELLVLWLTQNPLLAKDIVLENLERGLITNEKLLTQITKIINPPNYNKLLSILCPLNQHAAELIADYIEPAANTSGDRRALSSRFFAPESDVKKEEDTLLQYPKPF